MPRPKPPVVRLPGNIPIDVRPTTPRIPQPPVVRSDGGTPAPSSRSKYAKQIKSLLTKLRSVESEFYSIGSALRKLDTPGVLTAFGHSTFRAFVDAEVMSYDRAYRYMVVADSYPKAAALSLGVEKAFHLVQYAKVAKTRSTARTLAEKDSRIGTARRRVSELSAGEVQNLVRVLKMTQAKAEKPKPTTLEKRAAAELRRDFEERFGVDATVRVDKGRDMVRIELKLSEWMAE